MVTSSINTPNMGVFIELATIFGRIFIITKKILAKLSKRKHSYKSVSYLNSIFQCIILLGRLSPGGVSGFSELQPLLQPPQVIVELLPVAVRT